MSRDPVLGALARGVRGRNAAARGALLASARAWLARKPSTWTLSAYLDAPTVAFATGPDREWAYAVAAWIRDELARRRRSELAPNGRHGATPGGNPSDLDQ